jgi:shikimate kinase
MIVFLTGFMGSGKSRIGRELSKRTGWRFIDTDGEIEKRAHMSVTEIFHIRGEQYFRSLEEQIIEEICEITTDCIVALGGGALISDRSRETVLKNGYLIYIKSEAEAIYQRVQHTSKRPLLQEKNKIMDKREFLLKINKLLKIRERGYKQSHLTIQRDENEAKDIAHQILMFLKKHQHYKL